MLYVNLLIVILLLLLYILSLRHPENMPSDIDKGQHKLYFLYPMADLILSKTGLKNKVLNKVDISRKIQALNISDHKDTQIRLYWYQKTSLVALIIFAFSCISLIASIQSAVTKSEIFGTNIIRPEEGENSRPLKLKFRMENKEDSGDIYEDEIVVQNMKRIYSDEEWKEVLGKAIPYLEIMMLGDNETAEHVSKDLSFIRSIPDTGITVEWIPNDYRLISGNGVLFNEKIPDEGKETTVTAVLKYKDRRVEHTIPLTIWPIKSDQKRVLLKELQNTLDIIEEETGMSKEWHLPEQVGNYSVTWYMPESDIALSILIIGVFGSVLIWFYRDRHLDNSMKLRQNQMLLDYPEIINKFNLLVNAGMTIKQAWSKIAQDYRQRIEDKRGCRRYAYEEMLYTLNELRLGIPEANAYEQFGIRVGLLPYMKFSSVLIQNLKKGSRNMVEILRQEAMEAFGERKENTKRLGEEASTKLLGPMIMLLLVVLVIIIIPAFISFRM